MVNEQIKMWSKGLFLLSVLLNVYVLDASMFRKGYGFDRMHRTAPSMRVDFREARRLHRLGAQRPLVTPHAEPSGSIRVRKLRGELAHQFSNLTSYTMYVTTNKSCNANMFGWFFEHEDAEAPVLLWLQGGPGGTSLFGLFVENGPFFVYPNLTLGNRDYAWTKDYSVLYIDNPVGTGWSYTDNKTECYAHNQDDVARDLYTFLKAFFSYFNQFKNNSFYITGESYGGKYVPAIANKIIQNKDEAQKYFNFQGISVGDGFTDPINQIDTASLLYQIALVDDAQRDNLTATQNIAINQINNEQWIDAFNTLNLLTDGDLGQQSLFNLFTGLNYYFNFLFTNEPDDNYFVDFLNLPSTRQWIGVGNQTFSDGSLVEYHMREDFGKSSRALLENVLNSGHQVLLYNGQLDICVAPVLTEAYLKKMNWTGASDFQKAPKSIWRVDENDAEIAGYVKKADNLQYVVVRNAGHILPYDQPRAAHDLITRFVNKVPFTR